MTLIELSRDYRDHAAVLKGRIVELQSGNRACSEDARSCTDARVRMLTAMWRETRDLAVLCERYYERGYRRNEKYTL